MLHYANILILLIHLCIIIYIISYIRMLFEKIEKLIGGGILSAPDVYEAICAKQLKSNELGINQRTLSHWRKEGLFIFDTDFEKHEHIRFSFIEYVWLNIVIELRKYDIALDVIKTIKDGLTIKIPLSEIIKSPDLVDQVISNLPEEDRIEARNFYHDPNALKEADASIESTVLLLIVLESIIHQCHISLLVNINGEYFPFRFDQIEEIQQDEDFIDFYQKTHIAISISEIIAKYITGANLNFCTGKLKLITEREVEIIKLLRTEKLNSITIHFDDNSNLKLIEIEEKYNKIEKEARLIDLIVKRGYQTIELKTQDGNIVHCKNVKKIKYDTV
jgi:hypothetical protein